MKRSVLTFLAALPAAALAETALTVYNQNFAVVRETVPLRLQPGVNAVTFDRATLLVEPDSVVLRDPSGRVALRILEQSYRADTASQGLMLSLFEGKTLDFLVRDTDGKEFPVSGRVVRSGYAPGGQGGTSPIIEVDGKLRFSLPGEPIFPALADDAILRPTLSWQLAADRQAQFDAELGYITGGLSWQAAYNFVAPEKGNTLDLVGWVTLNNQSGRTFETARVKLMAGDVNKLAPPSAKDGLVMEMRAMAAAMPEEAVTQKSFDEFHLYSLTRPVTLRDRETKQVEFLKATGVKAPVFYVYDGAQLGGQQFRRWNQDAVRNDPNYGTQSNTKVFVYREFKNTKENGLGVPLPEGRTRFYRQDNADGRIEFTGENTIEHTPEGETVRLYLGDAFDIVGERRRTDYQLNNRSDQMEEAFEIKVRNRKKEPVEVRVVEQLYRGPNWTLLAQSDPHRKQDDRTIEFRVNVAPDEEKVVTYRVRYTWR
jgi:hypothetical protein